MSLEKFFVECVLSTKVMRVEARKASRVADLIREAQLPLGFSCGGRGACLACIVYTQGHFSEVGDREHSLLMGIESEDAGWTPRVACLAWALGPAKVRTTYW